MGIRNLGNNSGSQQQSMGAGGEVPVEAKLDIDIDKIAEDAAAKRKSERKGYADIIQSALETPQGSTISTGIVTLITVAILVFFAIGPAVNSVLDQLETNEFLRENISEISEKYTQINNNANYYQSDEIAPALEKFEEYLGDDPNQDIIYEELSIFTESADVEFRRVNFNIENTNNSSFQNEINQSQDPTINFFFVDPSLRFQTVTYEIIGEENDIQNFVEILESNNRGYDIISMAITSPRADAQNNEDDPDATKWRLVLNFSLPYWDPVTDNGF